MTNRSFFTLALLLLGVLLLSSSVYIVKETERAVLLRFGKVENADVGKGLQFKWPMVDVVRKFDGRVQSLDSPPEQFLNVEKKPLNVDSFAKWQIRDVSKFYTATNGSREIAQRLLAQRVNEGLRNEFGRRTLHEVVSGQRDEMMAVIANELNTVVGDEMGIDVIDVRIKRIELTEQVSGSVFNRMRTERERQAADYRAKGKEIAEGIRAEADREKVVIEAEAYRTAEQNRGEGDAQASSIYAEAYNKDPEFYAFVRSLQAYRETFANKGDTLVVDPDSDFFRYLKDSQGKK